MFLGLKKNTKKCFSHLGMRELVPQSNSLSLYKELRQFHARCVRTMSRTNLNHTWIYRISTKNRQKELVLDSTNNYIARRQLRWLAGHVSRMPFDRLPRRMLSSWFPAPRCTGAAKMTYGRTMKKAMATFDIIINRLKIGIRACC